MLVVDYYGHVWGMAPSGEPARCSLQDQEVELLFHGQPAAPAARRLTGWVATWDVHGTGDVGRSLPTDGTGTSAGALGVGAGAAVVM